MFEEEIKIIADYYSSKTKTLGHYFNYLQLLSLDLNPALLHYISAEIDYLIYEDRKKLLKDSVFDYSGEKISYYFSQIADEIKKSKRFSSDFISKLIFHAVTFNTHFVARPNWTLSKFIFGNGENKTPGEIVQLLNYVYYYPFLPRVIKSFFSKKKLLSVSVGEFESLLKRIDEITIQENGEKFLIQAIDSSESIFNLPGKDEPTIPVKAIKLFTKEKNLNYYYDLIVRAFPDEKVFVPKVELLTALGFKKEEKEEDELEKEAAESIVVEESLHSYDEEKSVKKTETEEEIVFDEQQTGESENLEEDGSDLQTKLPDEIIEEEDQPQEGDSTEEINLEETAEYSLDETSEKEEVSVFNEEIVPEEKEPETETEFVDGEEKEEETRAENKTDSFDNEFAEVREDEVETTVESVKDEKVFNTEQPTLFDQTEENETSEEAENYSDEERFETETENVLLEDNDSNDSNWVDNEDEEPVVDSENEPPLPNESNTEIVEEQTVEEEETTGEEKSVESSEYLDDEIPKGENIFEEVEASDDDEEPETTNENELEPLNEVEQKEELAEENSEIIEEEKNEVLKEEENNDEEIVDLESSEIISEDEFEIVEEENVEAVQNDLSEEENGKPIETVIREEESLSDGEIFEPPDTEGEYEEQNEKLFNEIDNREKDLSNEEDSETKELASEKEIDESFEEVENKGEADGDGAESTENKELSQNDDLQTKGLDPALLLKDKNTARIIEDIFDYDMEEFTNAIERLAGTTSSDEALERLDEIFKVYNINPDSKEGALFKKIVSDYFNNN